MYAARIDRCVWRDRTHRRLSDPREQVGRRREQPQSQHVPPCDHSRDVRRAAGNVGSDADDVTEFARDRAFHLRVEAALDRVLERLGGDRRVRRRREAEAPPNRERVTSPVRRLRRQRLRDWLGATEDQKKVE